MIFDAFLMIIGNFFCNISIKKIILKIKLLILLTFVRLLLFQDDLLKIFPLLTHKLLNLILRIFYSRRYLDTIKVYTKI